MEQTKFKLYLIPGFLTDKTIYQEFLSDKRIDCEVLEFLSPSSENESIEEYAKRMAEGINTQKEIILLGTSFGGILATEMAKFTFPKSIVFVSSVKNRGELNPLMKIDKSTFLLDYIPDKIVRNVIKAGYKVGAKLASNLKEIHNEDLQEMIDNIDGKLEKWIIKKINGWEGENQVSQFLHLHGDKDHVFPIDNIENYELIPSGNHNMILAKSKIIRDRVVKYLSELE